MSLSQLIIRYDDGNDDDANDDDNNSDYGNDDYRNYDFNDNSNDDDHTALSVLKEASHDWHLSKADGIGAHSPTFSDFHSANAIGPQHSLQITAT